MARQTKRNVTRSGNRADIVRRYNTTTWYELPDWVREWLVQNGWLIILLFTIILAPAALLATVLGINSLPLSYIGIPYSSTANDVGLAAAVLLLLFVLLVAAVRPLKQRRLGGLQLVVAAAFIRLGHGIILGRWLPSAILLAIALYLYWQLRRDFD